MGGEVDEDQDLPQHAQAEPIKKSNSEIDVKMDLDEVVYYEDNGQEFQVSKGVSSVTVSSKETVVSNGNDTDSSFDNIESEDEVRINF